MTTCNFLVVHKELYCGMVRDSVIGSAWDRRRLRFRHENNLHQTYKSTNQLLTNLHAIEITTVSVHIKDAALMISASPSSSASDVAASTQMSPLAHFVKNLPCT